MKIVRRSFCSLLAALLPVFVIAQQNTVTPVSLNKIGDNIYEVKGGRGANGGAFIGKSGVLLIDSKMDKESVDQTLTEIRKLTDKPIRFLVNTHSDGDHVFGNRFLPESVVFVAHENCCKELQTRVAGFLEKNYSLENLKKDFSEAQAGLVETVYNELTATK